MPRAAVRPSVEKTASIGVSYTLDLFGRNRRELEAFRAIVDYERFERSKDSSNSKTCPLSAMTSPVAFDYQQLS